MTKTAFQQRARDTITRLMETVEQAEILLEISGESIITDGPLDADIAALGAPLTRLKNLLGEGPGSDRAIFNKVRN